MPGTKNEIIAAISEAFKNVTLEDGIGLSEANAIDEYRDLQFREACRKNDEQFSWNTISSDLLNHYYCSLHFFDAKGMRFHLPAYLIADLNDEYRFGMVFTLAHLSDYTKSQFELLTGDQRNAVKLFLEFLLEHPDYDFEKPEIKSAIENYWSA